MQNQARNSEFSKSWKYEKVIKDENFLVFMFAYILSYKLLR